MTDQLRELGLTIGAIAGGVAGLGYLWRKFRGGIRLTDLLIELPVRLDTLEGKVDGLHARMDKAEADHSETLVAIADLDTKVDAHLSWSGGEMTRRTEAEAALWAAIKAAPDGP